MTYNVFGGMLNLAISFYLILCYVICRRNCCKLAMVSAIICYVLWS